MSSTLPSARVLIVLMAAVTIIGALLIPGPAGYLAILIVGIFAAVYWRTRVSSDRLFYLAGTGTLLVAACGAVSIWEGLAIAWLVSGTIAAAQGIMLSRGDLPAAAGAILATLAMALLIAWSDHVLLPLALLSGITGIVVIVMAIRSYRFRKQYAGGTTP
jgi:hypothetical protein